MGTFSIALRKVSFSSSPKSLGISKVTIANSSIVLAMCKELLKMLLMEKLT